MKTLFLKEKKVDRGFELCYWNLSYRRKFIRTLWTIPCLSLLVFFSEDPDENIKYIIVIWIIIFVIQLIYTYKKWMQEKIEKLGEK